MRRRERERQERYREKDEREIERKTETKRVYRMQIYLPGEVSNDVNCGSEQFACQLFCLSFMNALRNVVGMRQCRINGTRKVLASSNNQELKEEGKLT